VHHQPAGRGELRRSSPGSSGRRNADYAVRIVDENDVEVPPGTVGEIVARPLRPNLMFQGYWKRPEATLAVSGNLWFHSGDLGMFDEEGYFWFKDRKKDYPRRRGENISSCEVETTFFGQPDVKEVAIHAGPSGLTEDEVKATVVLQEGASVTEREPCEWSVDRLPDFGIPRFIEFRAELPKNAVGRAMKYELRDQGITESTSDREESGAEVRR
jgi:crotonobetaine/carnitine-CoA ligase